MYARFMSFIELSAVPVVHTPDTQKYLGITSQRQSLCMSALGGSVATGKRNVVIIQSAGERAYERVRPLIEAAKRDLIELAVAVGKEYRNLPKGERQVFCQKLGWSQGRIQAFAKVGEKFPAKQKVITSRRRDVCMDDLGVEHMLEISQTPDKTLEAAADAGMFDKPVSKRDIIRLRKTGQIPQEKSKPKTGIAQAKGDLDKAADKLRGATVNLNRLVYFMQKHSATQASGLGAFKLVSAIEGIADAIGKFDGETRSRAVEIIQGKREPGLPLLKFGVRPARDEAGSSQHQVLSHDTTAETDDEYRHRIELSRAVHLLARAEISYEELIELMPPRGRKSFIDAADRAKKWLQ